MTDLKDWWQSHYGTVIPQAHILRRQVPDRWLRIHSFPESKRYAETEYEYSILLLRHNVVAAEVLGLEAPCLLMVARYLKQSELSTH